MARDYTFICQAGFNEFRRKSFSLPFNEFGPTA